MTEANIVFPPRLPDDGMTDLKAAYPDAPLPETGYVTALPAIAYLASGAEWFAGAVKIHEHNELATRDAVFAAAVWREVETNLHHYFPQTIGMLAAMGSLRELLEGGIVSGIAKPAGSNRSEPMEPFRFADWNRTWEREGGLILVPGYWDLKINISEFRKIWPTGGNLLPLLQDVEPKGTLPPFAKPADRRDEAFAHQAAALVRSGTKLADALRRVAPEDLSRSEASIQQGIRRTYTLMYDRDGRAIQP